MERETTGLGSGGDVDPKRVDAGLKAALHNPNVSEVTKGAIAERLEGNGV